MAKLKVVKTPLRGTGRVWTCDVCGKGFFWEAGQSAVYGSLLTQEECIPQFYTCSEACRSRVSMPTDWRVKVESHNLSDRQRSVFIKCLRQKSECA